MQAAWAPVHREARQTQTAARVSGPRTDMVFWPFVTSSGPEMALGVSPGSLRLVGTLFPITGAAVLDTPLLVRLKLTNPSSWPRPLLANPSLHPTAVGQYLGFEGQGPVAHRRSPSCGRSVCPEATFEEGVLLVASSCPRKP